MNGKISLYLVATPIGNLGDLSPRAAEILSSVDFIAAEDTRNTLKLLNRFEIKKPMVSYYEHNKRERGEDICARLLQGEVCALVTDAGMPAVSDPGEELVRRCHELGLGVSVIPGPCAFVSALAVSGLPTGRFSFEGFLSVNNKNRREHLKGIGADTRTLIFYEAPHKLKKTLCDLYDALGDRRLTLVRELTKLHEEIIRTTLSQAADLYREVSPRGEFVLVIEGAKKAAPAEEAVSSLDAVALVDRFIGEGLSRSDAVKRAASECGMRKNELYQLYLGRVDISRNG